MKFTSLIQRLINYPNMSNINISVSAIMLHGMKPIGSVCTNIERNYIKGHVCPAIHAEVNAINNHFGKDLRFSEKYGWSINNLKNNKINKNLNIMVVRKKNDNTLGNARPCYKCTMMLQNIGIKKVYYSMDDKLYCEKVKDMISVNISSSWKQIEIINYDNNIMDYYRSIISKMPKIIKFINAKLLLEHITNEIIGCRYKLLNDSLIIYMNDSIIGKIIIN
jgi:deoxycytidylate deaminase